MTAITAAEPTKTVAADPEIEAMLEAGAHLGHAKSKRHPAMAAFVWGVRGGVEIIDLTKTKEKLARALDFLRTAAAGSKLFLFVGTRPSAKDIVKRVASELGCPYVDRRWIGGTLTNFKVISKRVETLEGLERDLATGGLEKYPKKERIAREKDRVRLIEAFDGLRRLRRLPDALVIADIAHDELALTEARRLGIPVVALTDTNTDPRSVTYAIPSNDDARPAITYMFGRIAEAIRQGHEEGALRAAEAAAAAAAATQAEEAPQV